MRYQRSSILFKEAQKVIPGGVNSPVRAFKSVGGQPIVFDRVKGPFAWDIDGNRYIDYIGSWGPAICGHAHPEVITALQEAIEKVRIALDLKNFEVDENLLKKYSIDNRKKLLENLIVK